MAFGNGRASAYLVKRRIRQHAIVVGDIHFRVQQGGNRLIDDTRGSGFLKASLERSGIVGIDVAPAGYGYGRAE